MSSFCHIILWEGDHSWEEKQHGACSLPLTATGHQGRRWGLGEAHTGGLTQARVLTRKGQSKSPPGSPGRACHSSSSRGAPWGCCAQFLLHAVVHGHDVLQREGRLRPQAKRVATPHIPELGTLWLVPLRLTRLKCHYW